MKAAVAVGKAAEIDWNAAFDITVRGNKNLVGFQDDLGEVG